MKISVNWLKDFLPSFSPDIAALVDRLTFLGLEVEEVIQQLPPDPLVVVGRIEEVRAHPNADRLKICMVDIGADALQQIVCGAPDVVPGMVVAVATIGARLNPVSGETFTIKKSKIRGEQSFGMICAADELGLSDDHTGVMTLDEGCRIGEPLGSYLEQDVVLDIAVTPNRPDVLSHLGVARELAESSEIVYPAVPGIAFKADGALVDVRDSTACPNYLGTVIRGITIAPSPRWLARKLEQIGLRPRNNIVDITNYILHAYGQPLHAFDLAKLSGGRIIVRSDADAQLTAINQNVYRFEPGILAICDAEKPVAIAGVMGGLESAVSSTTTDILLEAAYFNPAAIRSAAKRLQIASDSSYRYERGIDPCNVKRAAEYAIALILELAGGRVEEAVEWGRPVEGTRTAFIRTGRTNEMLGTSLTTEEISSLLKRIGFTPLSLEGERLEVAVPSFRVDVAQEIDLIEEVARLHGYNHIEPSSKMVSSYPVSRKVPEYFPDYLRNIMIGLNFNEVLTNPLIRKQEAALFEERIVPALNPISEELEVLRPSLAASMLKVVSHNIRYGNRDQRLFEVAHVFRSADAGERRQNDPLSAFREREHLALIITGRRHPRSWNHHDEEADFFDVRGSVEMLLEKLNLLDKSALNIYNQSTIGIETALNGDGKTRYLKAGLVQQLDREILGAFDIDQDVFLAEIDLAVLEECFDSGVAYEPPSKFPVVERDLSFVLPRNTTVQSLVELVRKSDPLIRSVRVFDVFERREADGSGDGERSVAISFALADSSGTLNDERINSIIAKVCDTAGSEIGAVIRQV